MADIQQLEFGQRVQKINKSHRKLAGGFVTTINDDGLMVARPHRKSSHQTIRSLFFCLVIMMAFKAFLYAQSGEQAYQQRVSLLQSGTIVEQVGGYVMYADPITVWVSGMIGNVTK